MNGKIMKCLLWNLNFSNFSKWDLNTNFIRQSSIAILGITWRIDYFFKINIAGVSMTFHSTASRNQMNIKKTWE